VTWRRGRSLLNYRPDIVWSSFGRRAVVNWPRLCATPYLSLRNSHRRAPYRRIVLPQCFRSLPTFVLTG
jgi:hypothetical protein